MMLSSPVKPLTCRTQRCLEDGRASAWCYPFQAAPVWRNKLSNLGLGICAGFNQELDVNVVAQWISFKDGIWGGRCAWDYTLASFSRHSNFVVAKCTAVAQVICFVWCSDAPEAFFWRFQCVPVGHGKDISQFVPLTCDALASIPHFSRAWQSYTSTWHPQT